MPPLYGSASLSPFGACRNLTPKRGVTVIASTQLMESEYRITINSDRQYSPVESFEAPMAAKARMATIVAPNSGHIVCLTMSIAASVAVLPFCWPIRMPSTTTMALSTSIPKAMIRAPRLMRSSITPALSIGINVAKTVRIKMAPITKALRNPMANMSTPMTMTTASIRLMTKLSMAVTTD